MLAFLQLLGMFVADLFRGRGASLKSRTSFFANSSILRAAPSTDSWE